MKFDFDKNKSESNLKKHGIDFIEAQVIWDDPDRLEIPAKSISEERYMLIGKVKDKLWSVIYTIRNYNIRIISVRRSRKLEVEAYES
jgi:uncharacterized DUF497 family protein